MAYVYPHCTTKMTSALGDLERSSLIPVLFCGEDVETFKGVIGNLRTVLRVLLASGYFISSVTSGE